MKEYVYFISFTHKFGTGNIEIKRRGEIRDIHDIRAIEKVLNDDGETGVCINNYKILDRFVGKQLADNSEEGE